MLPFEFLESRRRPFEGRGPTLDEGRASLVEGMDWNLGDQGDEQGQRDDKSTTLTNLFVRVKLE